MTTAIVLNAVLCVIAFAAIVRLSIWGLQTGDRRDGGERREAAPDERRDRIAA